MDDIMVISMILVWVVVGFNLLLTVALVRRVQTPETTKHSAKREHGLPAGTTAPDFTALTLNGETVTKATYAGRPTVFLVVSPTCAPCREELPTYEALRPQAERAGVQLVFVSLEGLDATRQWVEEANIHTPMLIAPNHSNPFRKDYHLPGTPAYCFVDSDGIIQSTGYPTPDQGEWGTLTAAWAAVAPPPRSSLVPSMR